MAPRLRHMWIFNKIIFRNVRKKIKFGEGEKSIYCSPMQKKSFLVCAKKYNCIDWGIKKRPEMIFCKVHIFWEGHKIQKDILLCFDVTK